MRLWVQGHSGHGHNAVNWRVAVNTGGYRPYYSYPGHYGVPYRGSISPAAAANYAMEGPHAAAPANDAQTRALQGAVNALSDAKVAQAARNSEAYEDAMARFSQHMNSLTNPQTGTITLTNDVTITNPLNGGSYTFQKQEFPAPAVATALANQMGMTLRTPVRTPFPGQQQAPAADPSHPQPGAPAAGQPAPTQGGAAGGAQGAGGRPAANAGASGHGAGAGTAAPAQTHDPKIRAAQVVLERLGLPTGQQDAGIGNAIRNAPADKPINVLIQEFDGKVDGINGQAAKGGKTGPSLEAYKKAYNEVFKDDIAAGKVKKLPDGPNADQDTLNSMLALKPEDLTRLKAALPLHGATVTPQGHAQSAASATRNDIPAPVITPIAEGQVSARLGEIGFTIPEQPGTQREAAIKQGVAWVQGKLNVAQTGMPDAATLEALGNPIIVGSMARERQQEQGAAEHAHQRGADASTRSANMVADMGSTLPASMSGAAADIKFPGADQRPYGVPLAQYNAAMAKQQLVTEGFAPGLIGRDGVNDHLAAVVIKYQAARGLEQTGQLDSATMQSLAASAHATTHPAAQQPAAAQPSNAAATSTGRIALVNPVLQTALGGFAVESPTLQGAMGIAPEKAFEQALIKPHAPTLTPAQAEAARAAAMAGVRMDHSESIRPSVVPDVRADAGKTGPIVA